MSFAIFSDSSCNLPKAQLEEFQVQIISSSYEREGKLITCPPYPEDFALALALSLSPSG